MLDVQTRYAFSIVGGAEISNRPRNRLSLGSGGAKKEVSSSSSSARVIGAITDTGCCHCGTGHVAGTKTWRSSTACAQAVSVMTTGNRWQLECARTLGQGGAPGIEV